MFKRLFFAAVGLGAGVTLGVWSLRKIEATQRKLSPEYLVGRAGSKAGGVRDRIAAALDEGRRAAAAREAELRAELALPRPPAGRAP